MTDDSSDAKAFGQTLFDLMHSGASEEVLGQFALRRAQRLMVERGERAAMPAASDLEALLEGFATRVVEKVLKQAGVAVLPPTPPPPPPELPPWAAGPGDVRLKKISCRLFGKPTSLSVPQGLLGALKNELGTKQFRQTMVDFAESAPSLGDRSSHVRDRMTELWEKLQVPVTGDGAPSRLQ